MSAYYAPAFFAYLLGKCLRRQRPIVEVLKLGLVVVGTFALIWCPYLNSVDAFLEVCRCILICLLSSPVLKLYLCNAEFRTKYTS